MNPNSNEAQRTRILEWLRGESLTTLQAREHLDIMHPAGRIKELRKLGFNILTYWSIESTGKANHRVARYVLLASVPNG
ncbi:MAG: helix-turn-helix domain-containing protein [Methylococcales bacterium]